MSTEPTGSKSARRLLAMLRAMAGHTVSGVRNIELCKASGMSPTHVSKALSDLAADGWVQRVPNAEDRWCLGPTLIQIALAFESDLQRSQLRLDEVRQRYTRQL